MVCHEKLIYFSNFENLFREEFIALNYLRLWLKKIE